MTVLERIAAAAERLSPAERRVAEVVAGDLSAVAFGTVAQLAGRATTSGPTVVRLAAKLGFPGYAGLQAAIQEELADRLRPAAERIRDEVGGDPLTRARQVEVGNVRSTLDGVDRAAYRRAVRLLADRRRQVLVLSGEASAGVADVIADELDLLRPGVSRLRGPDVSVARRLAGTTAGDVVLALELRRYERWVLDAAGAAVDAGVRLLAVTDSLLSPLGEAAEEVFVVTAAGAGPFDSHVGSLALGNALVAGVAERRRGTATDRLDRVEAATRPYLR